MSARPLAKLTRPRAEGLIRRERLFALLDEARQVPFVWLSGPPGAGKTSLVSSYLDDRKLPVLWYQVDAGDADPATFFHYLALAAHDGRARAGKALPTFGDEHAARPETFARRFFRELFSGLPEHTVVVLDNYQDAPDDAALHAVVREAAEEIPAGVNVLAISRAEPAASLARLRATHRLYAIGADPLRFTRDETAAVAGDLTVDGATLDALEAQANGWAAGVVLILDRVRETGRIRAIGSAENLETVFDYFAGQAFHAAPKDTQDMLVRLAYLPRMTAAQAEAVTGNPAAGRLLATLSKRNLFTDRRFGDETSYQFHALFRAFLRECAREQLGLSEHQRVGHSAAALLQATGQFEDAFELFVECGRWDAAARLIERQTDHLLAQGRRQTLRRWLEALPAEVVNRSAGLTYAMGVVQFGYGAGRHALGREYLESAFEQFLAEGDIAGQLRAATVIAESYYVEASGMAPLEPWIERFEALLAHDTPTVSPDLRVRSLLSLARSRFYLRPGDKATREVLTRLAQEIDDSGLAPDTVVIGRAFQLLFGWFYGDVRGNDIVIARTDPLLADPGVSDTSRITYLFYQINHYAGLPGFGDDRFQEIIHQARAMLDESGMSPLATDFVRMSALLLIRQRRYEEARDRIVSEVMPQVGLQRASQRPFTYWSLGLAELGLGHHEAALALARSATAMARDTMPVIRWLMVPTTAALLMACGAVGEGLDLLDYLEEDLGTDVPALLAGRVEVGRAFAALLESRTDDTVSWLRRGVPEWARDPYAGRMLLPDPRFSRLLALALAHGIEADFVADLIVRYKVEAPDADVAAWPWPVRVYALGVFRFEVQSGTAPGPKSSHRLLDLLRAIVAFGESGAPAERLADALWPDSDGDAAQNTLQVSLYRLRKLLGHEDAVAMRDGKVVVDRRVCWIDAWAFERRAKDLCTSIGHGADEAQTAGEVLALYRGPLFADQDEQPWMLPARKRLHTLWLEAVRKIGRDLEEQQRWDEARAMYSRAIALDGTQRELQRGLERCDAERDGPS